MAVYRRGKTWWYVFEFGGRRIQESLASETRRPQFALKRSARWICWNDGRDSRSLSRFPSSTTFVEQFLEWSKQQHRPKTYELHKLNCETLKRFFRGKYLDEITSEMVEDFKSARKQERIQWAKNRSVTGATVNRALTTLKLLYHQAERSGTL